MNSPFDPFWLAIGCLTLGAMVAACSGDGPREASLSPPVATKNQPTEPRAVLFCVVGDWHGLGTDSTGLVSVTEEGSATWQLAIPGTETPSKTTAVAMPGRPIAGDWNGDGIDEIGWFSQGHWYLSWASEATPPAWTTTLQFGLASDIPVVGDWTGQGRDSIGVFRDGVWFLKEAPTGNGVIEESFGIANDHPLVGDWNGDGTDSLGVSRSGAFHLCDSCSDGLPEYSFSFGTPGQDEAVAIDHDGDGAHRIALVTDLQLMIRSELAQGFADATIDCGPGHRSMIHESTADSEP